jgi:hypothetical protein
MPKDGRGEPIFVHFAEPVILSRTLSFMIFHEEKVIGFYYVNTIIVWHFSSKSLEFCNFHQAILLPSNGYSQLLLCKE